MRLFSKILLTSVLALIFTIDAFAISASVRSNKDYYFATRTLREIKPMVENFKTDELKKQFDEIVANFEEATLEYFGRNYDSSSTKFYNLKISIMQLLDKMNTLYIDRTKDLLKSTTEDNQTVEIFIDIDRRNGIAAYFNKPFDPLRDVKPYNETFTAKDYHFYYDAKKLERYIQSGYFYYQEAIRIKNDPVIDYIKSKKKIKSDSINYIIERFIASISYCRTAKQCGLEVYKIRNEHNVGVILSKYDIRQDQLTPIFDDRIPEKFKADAVDNVKLMLSVELERRKKALDRMK